MENAVYKLIEITGTSPKGTDDAVQNAITRAGQSVKHMDWFEVVETRGYIDQSAVRHWQVTVKIGFRIED